MADRKITDLTALAAGSQATGDLLTIVDVSESAAADKNKKITVESLFKGIPGNVGIGTATAGRTLSVDGSIQVSNSTSGFGLGEGFEILHESSGATYLLNRENAETRFYTNNTERMRIDSSGRVLIGTTSSVSSGGGDLLEVASGVGNILITSTNSTRVADQACGQLRFWGKAGANEELAKIAAVADGTHGAGDKPTRLTFSVTADGASSPTERMRITQSGTIGMGTDEPMADARLTLAGVNDVALGFKRSGSGKFDNAIHCDGGSMIFKGGLNANTVSGLYERMRINSAGRLLIGTTTEGAADADNLTIADSGNCGMTIRSGASNNGGIFFSDGTSGVAEYQGTILYDHSGNNMRFQTGATERMRIDSSGNVGIGTSTINRPLVVYGNSFSAVSLNTSSSGTAAADGVQLQISGSNGYLWNYENGKLIFGTNNAERVRIQSAGGISFNGDTAAANALSDYEEGTFTPTMDVSGISGTLSVSYSSQNGRYIKVGRTVFFTIDIRLSNFSRGTGTGGIVVGSLPYVPVNTGNFARSNGFAHLYNWNYSSTAADIPLFSIRQTGSQSFMDIRNHRLNNTDTDVNDPDNDSMIFLTGTYETV